MSLHVVVPGVPQGQGRISTYGRGMTVHSNAKTLLPWRMLVTARTRQAMHAAGGSWPLRGPVELSVRFYLPRGGTVRRWLPWVRPDGSHLERAVEDALTNAGVWEDDSRVVHTEWWKFYPQPGHRFHMGVPGCVIDVSTVTEDT